MKKKLFLLIFLLLFSNTLFGYEILSPAFNISAGDIILNDFNGAVLKNCSLNAFREQNSLILTGNINNLDVGDEELQKMNGILSITVLKNIANIDIAYNIFSSDYYSENFFIFGLSRKIIRHFGMGVSFKYNQSGFKLTYDNETDPLFNSKENSKTDINTDISCSGEFGKFFLGLNFENVLSSKEVLTDKDKYDMPFILRINAMTSIPDFLIFKDNYTGTEIALDKEYIDKKLGFSFGMAKYLNMKLGTILNTALTTGLDFKYNISAMNVSAGYAMKYMYDLGVLSHIVSFKIMY